MGAFVKLTLAKGEYAGQPIYLNTDKIVSFYAETEDGIGCENGHCPSIVICDSESYYVKEDLATIELAIEEAKNRTFSHFSSELATGLWSRGIGL